MTTATIDFTPIEVRSYLPGGWSLVEGSGSSEDDRWSAVIIDGADMEWPLEVTGENAAKLGRVEALRHAIDRVYREALG